MLFTNNCKLLKQTCNILQGYLPYKEDNGWDEVFATYSKQGENIANPTLDLTFGGGYNIGRGIKRQA